LKATGLSAVGFQIEERRRRRRRRRKKLETGTEKERAILIGDLLAKSN
jgi:hypothetical protein